MKIISFLLLLLGALTASAAVINKRVDTDFPLYIWGDGVFAGVPVFYSDGYAFASNTSTVPVGSKINTNITFHTDHSPPAKTNLTITSDTPDVLPVDPAPEMFINPVAKESTPVGFTNVGSGYTSQFFMFGDIVVWQENGTGLLESFFYVTPIDGSPGLWSLNWNPDRVDDGVSIDIALRYLSPT